MSAAEGMIVAQIRRRPRLLLLLICLIAWLPGLWTIPALDRDESRFAQASKQMLESGNFIDIRFANEPRYKKPVGIYWLQAASTELVGLATGERDRIWSYRLPSLIGAIAAVLLCFWCAGAFLSVEGSFVAALLLGLTLLLCAEAKIAKTDAVLLASIVAMQGVLLRAYLAQGGERTPPTRWVTLGGWLALALGILIKGPVILGVAAVTLVAVLIWDRQWRWLAALRPLSGIALTLAIVLPWLIAIAVQSHGAFYAQSLGHDFGAKLARGEESHGEPPGYYLLMTILTLWPATLFLIPAIVSAVRHRAQPAMRFLMAWAGASWLMFEIVPTKLPHYILPAYPALTILMAAYLVRPAEAAVGWRRMLPALSSLHFALGAALLTVGLTLLPQHFGGGTSPDLLIGAAIGALLALLAAFSMLSAARGRAFWSAAASALVFYAVLTLDAMPRLEKIWVSPREAAMIRAHSVPADPSPVLAGYTEPSALFLLGTGTHLAANGRDAAQIAAAQGGLAAIEDGQRPLFLETLSALEGKARPVDALAGFNYSRGRDVHITLFRVTPARQTNDPPAE
ncbi:MAG: glycosyltransferase family 39 protein [Alphaproteobacteria bacterium]|nr:glycosyltransferase family 39 protein [Alphaproteobacteria bacterium]